MRLLLLGGTAFVGRAIVRSALDAGHDVTVFNRGRTNPGLFDDVTELRGDRDTGDYAALAGQRWDATVDVTAYIPRHVTQLADALGGGGGRHVFISTGSVYAPDGLDTYGEEAPRHPPERGTEEVTNATYGPLKVACEDDALARHEHVTIVRPGIVAGPHDPTDRFTYWVRRVARGGPMLVPDRPDQPIQLVDARDLAAFVLALVESSTDGVFNAVGPAEPTTVASMIDACADAVGQPADPVWVDPAWLAERSAPWPPLVIPAGAGMDGLFRRSPAAAVAAGMTHRPLTRTAADIVGWLGDEPHDGPWYDRPAATMSDFGAGVEAELLDAWRTRS